LMISPAGAESVADKLKQTLDKLKQLQGQQQPNQTSSPRGQAAAPNQNNAPKVSSSQGSAASSGSSVHPDILGIKLGADLAETRAALSKHGPPNKIEEIRGELQGVPSSGFVSVSRMLMNSLDGDPNAFDHTVVYFTAPPNKQRAALIARQSYFSVSKRPALDSLTQSLRSKYGAPSSVLRNNIGQLLMMWVWNEQGRLVAVQDRSEQQNHCSLVANTDIAMTFGLRSTRSGNLANGDNWTEKALGAGCNKVVAATFHENNGVVLGFSVAAKDFNLIVDARKNTANYVTELKKREQQETMQKAKSQKGPAL